MDHPRHPEYGHQGPFSITVTTTQYEDLDEADDSSEDWNYRSESENVRPRGGLHDPYRSNSQYSGLSEPEFESSLPSTSAAVVRTSLQPASAHGRRPNRDAKYLRQRHSSFSHPKKYEQGYSDESEMYDKYASSGRTQRQRPLNRRSVSAHPYTDYPEADIYNLSLPLDDEYLKHRTSTVRVIPQKSDAKRRLSSHLDSKTIRGDNQKQFDPRFEDEWYLSDEDTQSIQRPSLTRPRSQGRRPSIHQDSTDEEMTHDQAVLDSLRHKSALKRASSARGRSYRRNNPHAALPASEISTHYISASKRREGSSDGTFIRPNLDYWASITPEKLDEVVAKRGATGSVDTSADDRELDNERNRESGFQHPPMDYTRQAVRLVRILPGSTHELLECEFHSGFLDDDDLWYTALSYTWGEANRKSDIVPIVLDQQTFWIRNNLHDFLRLAQSNPYLCNRLFWIDALCVDQKATHGPALEEKNHQVRIMGQIYHHASEVICWLGEAEDDREAFELEQLQHYIHAKKSPFQQKLPKVGARALGRLVACSYWTRMWTIQELLIAKAAIIRRGDFATRWDTFTMLLREDEQAFGVENGLDRANVNGFISWSSPRRRPPFPASDILTMIHHFLVKNCKDPKDKVYALFGLLDRPPVQANYNMSCQELYGNLMRFAVEQDWFLRGEDNNGALCTEGTCLGLIHVATALKLEMPYVTHVYRHLEIDYRLRHHPLHPFDHRCKYYEKRPNLDL